MSAFLDFSTTGALLLIGLSMCIALVRLFLGPTAQDRILALDFINVCAMLTILVFGIRHESGMYFEAALLIALFGGVATSALARFLLRGEVIE